MPLRPDDSRNGSALLKLSQESGAKEGQMGRISRLQGRGRNVVEQVSRMVVVEDGGTEIGEILAPLNEEPFGYGKESVYLNPRTLTRFRLGR